MITALALMMFLCLLLGWACYRLITDREKSKQHEASWRKEWMDEKKEVDRYLSGVLRVLNSNVGGISKRISESAEIAEAIQSQAPDLFKRCDGLAYWLHANDQFLVSLYAVAEEGIDCDHRRRVHEMKTTGEREVFGRIYEGAGLSPPSLRIEPCQPIS
ncbi:MAG: hypothetical protein PHF58_14125 [Methylotenera sp.]|nr:hypothetical protein [Methylotenera sp.]